MSILVYGATGYTGTLIARMARRMGVSVTLAGRNEAKLSVLAAETGYRHSVFDLDGSPTLLERVAAHDVVLHAAGPFSKTAAPMVEACLAGGTHYLDITGEIPVFEAHRKLDRRARAAGIMIMSGVGFDIVPSDCLSLHMIERMPTAVSLTLGLRSIGRGMGEVSRGTARTASEGIHGGTATRREGTIVYAKTPPRRQLRFGDQTVDCVGVSWGDVATAYYTTGIANIGVYFEATKDLERIVALPGFVRWLLSTALGQAFLRRQIEKRPDGPDPEIQKTQVTEILAIVEDAAGCEMRSILRTPGAYYLTAMTALRVAAAVDGGRCEPGTHNPAPVFGADLITTFEGCAITDMD